MASMAERPLSPHLFVYRFQYTFITSFANRITGILLSVGTIILAYWLMAVAAGPREYSHARQVLSLGIFKMFYALLLLSFSYHLIAGIRHLIWDTGTYMEKAQSKRSASVVIVVSLLLTAIFVYWAFCPGARAP